MGPRPRKEAWPSNISQLFRLYKEAAREFLRHLYVAASDVVSIAELDRLVRIKTSQRQREEEEEWKFLLPNKNPHLPLVILTNTMVQYSTNQRFPPEMMMVLQAEISGRLLVDAWSREDMESRPYDAESHGKVAAHEEWTAMLQRRMEILRPEYERWRGNAAESLAGVSDELFLISLGG